MTDHEHVAIESAELEALVRLSTDLREAARHLTRSEARYLVDTYYQIQQYRIEAANQTRAGTESVEPAAFVDWLSTLFHRLEGSIKSALDAYTNEQTVGRWARSIVGVGPVLSAGLLAHIDITHGGGIKTAGQIWRFCGLDPTSKWSKGEKRPWNAKLRTICFNLGESFIKQQNREGAIYGPIYAQRKQLEIARNDAGENAAAAAMALQNRNFRKDTVARRHYEQGKLPPAHVHARARRYAVKLFLAGYHEIAYFSQYGVIPPKPYVFTREEYSSHTHWFMAPDPEGIVPGLREAQEVARTWLMPSVLPESSQSR